MKVTLYKTNSSMDEITQVECSHITMFENYKLKMQFGSHRKDDQLKLIKACIEHFVLIEIQGYSVTVIPEKSHTQRVAFRFD
jgi:hypothetical protein